MSELNENARPRVTVQHFATNDERTIMRLRAELAAAIRQRDEAVDIAATHQRNWYEAKTEFGAARVKMSAALADAIKQRDEARVYCIALQRAIEHHRRGAAVPPKIADNCPHHARMLNELLASKEGGGA